MRRWLVLVCLAACGDGARVAADAGVPDAGPGWSAAPALAAPVANNAIAAVADARGCTLYSVAGIDASLAASGIVASAARLEPGAATWTALPPLPGSPRIAASAVALRGELYVLGGYSVAAGGAETSHAEVAIFDPARGAWRAGPALPIAIDDAIAVAWRDRWIVVVSGWSQTRPVSDVQLYDAATATWTAATAFPGRAVFGHAGAIVGDALYLADGVAAGVGGFTLVAQAWRGALDPADPTAISWQALPPHPGPARYRAAAGALADAVVVTGGTDDPYNFDGVSYDHGAPSPPLASGYGFAPADASYHEVPDAPVATMDHRGLAACPGALFAIGGLVAGPAATAAVWRYR